MLSLGHSGFWWYVGKFTLGAKQFLALSAACQEFVLNTCFCYRIKRLCSTEWPIMEMEPGMEDRQKAENWMMAWMNQELLGIRWVEAIAAVDLLGGIVLTKKKRSLLDGFQTMPPLVARYAVSNSVSPIENIIAGLFLINVILLAFGLLLRFEECSRFVQYKLLFRFCRLVYVFCFFLFGTSWFE